MSPTVQIIIAVVSSSAFTAIVSAVIEWVKNKSGMQQAMKMLMYTSIKGLCEEYIARGSIGTEELEVLLQMHDVYHNKLKGNGYLDALIDKVKALPITAA